MDSSTNMDVTRQPTERTGSLNYFLQQIKDVEDDVLVVHTAIKHLENLQISFHLPNSEKNNSKDKYRKRIVSMFFENIGSFHKSKNMPCEFIKDETHPFLLGEMCMNHHKNAICSRVSRSRAFYMFARKGDVLDLKVDKVTDSNYELLILHKHSLRFKLSDLKLIAILPKIGTTIALATTDYIRATVIDYDRKTLQLIVSLDESLMVKELKDLKLGKLKPTDAACDKVTTNQKYYYHYLAVERPMLSNASEWQKEVEVLGVNPFVTSGNKGNPNRKKD